MHSVVGLNIGTAVNLNHGQICTSYNLLSVYGRFTYVLYTFVLGCFANVLEALLVVSLTSCRAFFELEQNFLKMLAQEE